MNEMNQFVPTGLKASLYWARRLHGEKVQEPEMIGKNVGLVLVDF